MQAGAILTFLTRGYSIIAMLVQLFPCLRDNRIVRYVKVLLESKYSAVFVAACILVSNLFSWEIPMMYTMLAFVALASLFAEDMLCTMPVACGLYFIFSRKNNPLGYEQTSIFLTPMGKINLWIVIGMLALFVALRWTFDVIAHKERRKFPMLGIGFIVLGVAYMLGGLFTEHYKWNTVFFGFTEIAALSFSYFFFYYTVDFKKVDKSYFAYLMMVMGVLLSLEVVGMLQQAGFFEKVFIEGEGFDRGQLYTGWGIYNNVAGAMIICIPAPFYYATVKKSYNWVYLLIGNLFYAVILFIQSRGGMLFGSFIYGVCLLLTCWKSKRRKSLLLTQGILFALLGIGCVICWDVIVKMFYSVIEKGMNDAGRFDIYFGGLDQFFEAPFFGNGFYECGAFRWGDNSIGEFLPARYHNTAVQLIASTGSVGFLAYCYHRVETLRMVFRRRNVEKYFIGLCVLGLLLTSLLDCHMFNFGPGLTYSALLLLLEFNWKNEEEAAKEIAATKETEESLTACAEQTEGTELFETLEPREETEAEKMQTEEVGE